MMYHTKQHTEELPKCKYCGKGFKWLQYVRKHEKKVCPKRVKIGESEISKEDGQNLDHKVGNLEMDGNESDAEIDDVIGSDTETNTDANSNFLPLSFLKIDHSS